MGSEASVLIVGAGAAGLAAARDLAIAGIEVTVVEARERVGGRIHTRRDSNLIAAPLHSNIIPVELGAEFVHGKHPQLLQVITASGAPFYDVTDRHWYCENGVFSDSRDFWTKLTALMDQIDSRHADCSFQDFLDSLPDDEANAKAKNVAKLYVQGFHAANANRIGVHGLLKANEAEDEIDGHQSFRVLGGYDTVTETLREEAQAHGAVIHLNTIVKELRWSNNEVEAVCIADKRLQRITGSHAVITLPLGVLQAKQHQRGAVRFVPELPRETQAAIQGLAMGHAVRIVLQFRERFWEQLDLPGQPNHQDSAMLGFIHDPAAPVPTWWTLLPVRAAVMVGWAGGPDAEKFIGQDEGYAIKQALVSLQQILGASENSLRQLLTASFSHDWSSDPFSRGAYAYLPVNGLEAQHTLARTIDDTLFFAGEATSVGHIGTVHGAIASGHRAAKEILELVK